MHVNVRSLSVLLLTFTVVALMNIKTIFFLSGHIHNVGGSLNRYMHLMQASSRSYRLSCKVCR